MKVEQFVMAYGIEQDRVRALLPEGFESLRPVLRINAEIRDEQIVYLEFNTPVEARGIRGWMNIAHWDSCTDDISFARQDNTVHIKAPFFSLTYHGTGIEGGCPAEKDNDGCFFLGECPDFRPNEPIIANKEFCDCAFSWHFHDGDAHGKSLGKTLPAYREQHRVVYPKAGLTAENAARIPCRQVLGAYLVRFER